MAQQDPLIVTTTKIKNIKDGLNLAEADIIKRVVERLAMVGEKAVTVARKQGTYQNVTGNLRSSIGYVILQNGKPVVSGDAEQIGGTDGDGSKGVKEGQALLTKLQGEFKRGIVLIVCAGMNYAYYVENLYHLNVLASAELEANRLADQLLKGLTK